MYEEKRNVYRIFVGKEERDHSEGRIILWRIYAM
jgi:hypothetical protein